MKNTNTVMVDGTFYANLSEKLHIMERMTRYNLKALESYQRQLEQSAEIIDQMIATMNENFYIGNGGKDAPPAA